MFEATVAISMIDLQKEVFLYNLQNNCGVSVMSDAYTEFYLPSPDSTSSVVELASSAS